MSLLSGYCGGEGFTLPGRTVLLSVAILLFSAVSVVTASYASEGGSQPGREAPGTPKEVIAKDGAPMVLIPGGDFVMGSPDEEGYEDEHPEHRVSLAAFYLDKYEVTNARYDKFLEDTGHVRPEYWEQLDLSVHGEVPVVGVAWADGQAYCEWAGKRLPTEAEWEYAARGMDRRRYPWGNTEPDAHLANYGKRWSHKFYQDRLATAKSHEEGKGPYGTHNMAGNVWEWVADWYEEKYYQGSPAQNPPGPPTGKMKVVRGGSWNFSPQYLRAASRLKFPPISRTADIGVRCARDSQ
jgi:formylglycine-generating enzyme required for sulfatase activity